MLPGTELLSSGRVSVLTDLSQFIECLFVEKRKSESILVRRSVSLNVNSF